VLLGDVIYADETIALGIPKSQRGTEKIDLFVGLEPRVIEVGTGAAAVVVKGENRAAVVIEVGVEAGDVAGLVGFAGKAVDTVVVILAAAVEFMVIRAAGRVGQCAEVIVEGMVLLHDHDHVFHFFYVAVGKRWFWCKQRKRERQNQKRSNISEQTVHQDSLNCDRGAVKFSNGAGRLGSIPEAQIQHHPEAAATHRHTILLY
jgi:hypothetical protein